MDAFLGLLIMSGATHQSKVKLKELWEHNMNVPSFFSAVMSRNRMQEIMTFLRFDDKNTREERKKEDKLSAVRELYELVVHKFKSNYYPAANLTIDERISPFKGRVGFKVYMPNKPQKYGIKLWLCCDAESYYVTNFEIYSGKVGEKSEINQGENVVLKLTKELKSGHNITTDNFFTSVPLAIKLLQRPRPLTLLGTIKSNRKWIPDWIKNHDKKDEYSSKFAFSTDVMLVSYIPKKNKSVVVLSSSDPNDKVAEDEKKKPSIILEYNLSKCGVDKLDEITKSLSVIRGTRRWTVNIFYNMLDMACYNSYICYKMASNKRISRRAFLLQLSHLLCQPYASNRVNVPQVLMSDKNNIRQFFLPPQAAAPISKPSKRSRCAQCPGGVKFATRCCSKCQQSICVDHQVIYCPNCS